MKEKKPHMENIKITTSLLGKVGFISLISV